MECCNNRLVIELQSGEIRNYGMTIETQVGNTGVYKPMNLSQYTIEVDIKKYPYASVESLIHKELIESEAGLYDSYILPQVSSSNPDTDTIGKFVIGFTLDDISLLEPNKDYYIIITLVNGEQRIIISGEGDNVGILRLCNS